MSDYPTKVWEAADGHTYKTEREAVEASKTYFIVQYLLSKRPELESGGINREDFTMVIRWVVANPEVILEAIEEAKKHAETKVVPS